MSARPSLLAALPVAAAAALAFAQPVLAQSRAEIETASAAPVLDLSSGASEAIRAARAAQAPRVGGAAIATGASASAPGQGTTLASLTVPAQPDRKPRVVASTDAASLSSPNFSAQDVDTLELAVPVGGASSVGAQKVDNTHVAGFLAVNPQGGATRTDVGWTNVFATR